MPINLKKSVLPVLAASVFFTASVKGEITKDDLTVLNQDEVYSFLTSAPLDLYRLKDGEFKPTTTLTHTSKKKYKGKMVNSKQKGTNKWWITDDGQRCFRHRKTREKRCSFIGVDSSGIHYSYKEKNGGRVNLKWIKAE